MTSSHTLRMMTNMAAHSIAWLRYGHVKSKTTFRLIFLSNETTKVASPVNSRRKRRQYVIIRLAINSNTCEHGPLALGNAFRKSTPPFIFIQTKYVPIHAVSTCLSLNRLLSTAFEVWHVLPSYELSVNHGLLAV